MTWYLNFEDSNDRIELFNNLKKHQVFEFKKNRPDDFIEELKHIQFCLNNKFKSPIDIKYGLETMKILKKFTKIPTNFRELCSIILIVYSIFLHKDQFLYRNFR